MSLALPPPPTEATTPANWVRKNLFNNFLNSILTIGCLVAIALGLKEFFTWALTQAQWNVLKDNLTLFLAGRFPADSLWRLWAIVTLLAGLGGVTWGKFQASERLWNRFSLIAFSSLSALIVLAPIELTSRLMLAGQILLIAIGYWLGYVLNYQLNHWLSIAWLVAFPIIFWLIRGGLGLREVPTSDWSGLLLTVFTSAICLLLAFPLGVLLALARQSELPVVRWFATLYIEILRGLPLIGVLFIAIVMIPLVLPPQMNQPDPLLRGILGLALFSSAYIAESVRGGLQSIPRGQLEAARALGLNPFQIIVKILLPQALRAVIPALVGEFVNLFKETTLLSLFGLVELLGLSATILANPDYIGRYAEVYLFVGVIYGLFCYSMSVASQRLEAKLEIGQR
jgi:general L-amino acid transport system permease protein